MGLVECFDAWWCAAFLSRVQFGGFALAQSTTAQEPTQGAEPAAQAEATVELPKMTVETTTKKKTVGKKSVQPKQAQAAQTVSADKSARLI